MRALVLLLILLSTDALACKCPQVSLEEHIGSAEYVGLVRLGSVHFNPAYAVQFDVDEVDFSVEAISAEFEALDTFKGDPGGIDRLTSNYGNGDCGMPLQPGTDYLVVGSPQGRHLSISYCSASIPLGPRSISHGRKHPAISRLRDETMVEAVRRHVLSSEPLHACLDWPGRFWSATQTDEKVCERYFDTLETRAWLLERLPESWRGDRARRLIRAITSSLST